MKSIVKIEKIIRLILMLFIAVNTNVYAVLSGYAVVIDPGH